MHLSGSRFRRALEQLDDPDVDVREQAMEILRELAKDGLSGNEAVALLLSATVEHPPRKYEWQDTTADLIDVAETVQNAGQAAMVRDMYPSLGGAARCSALRLLARLDGQEAIETYLALLRAWGWPSEGHASLTHPLAQNPRHGEVLFPALIDGSINDPRMLGYGLCLAYLNQNALDPAVVKRCAPGLLADYAKLYETLLPLQSDEGIAWRFSEDYSEPRIRAGLLLDLMGWFDTEEVRACLAQALDLKDPRLRHFALLSSLRRGAAVESAHVEAVAASPEMRGWLFGALSSMNRLELFPREHRTQAALAEWDMVNWLTYPTELGQEPDEIQLMKVIEVETDDDDAIDYYVFRFRTYPPHWAADDGWMAGVSGPFLRSRGPSVESYGDTFSAFTPWDQFDPATHLGSIRELMDKWREHHKR